MLFDALICARLRLPPEKLGAYMARLASDRRKHLDYLAEMLPLLRVDAAVPAQHEVIGRGARSRTIDWDLGPTESRMVLLDVKRRFKDFFAYVGATLPIGRDGEPHHDHALMFRSVEEKFVAADPDHVLQGVWICTDIKQEESEFEAAFGKLDAEKVHFVIVADAEPDVHILTRRPSDRAFLLELFAARVGSRFVFQRGVRPAE